MRPPVRKAAPNEQLDVGGGVSAGLLCCCSVVDVHGGFMKMVGAVAVGVALLSSCGGMCVDCAPPAGERSVSMTPFLRNAAAVGEVWWVAGAGEAWLLDRTTPLEVAAVTPTLTALRVPLGAALGLHLVSTADVDIEVTVIEPAASDVPQPADLVVRNGRATTIKSCASTCLDGPFDQVQTIELDVFQWDTTLAYPAASAVLVDIWGPDDDVDDETAPRLGDSVPLPTSWGGWLFNDAIVLQVQPGETALTLRLRSLLDGASGPQSRAE